MGNEVNRRKWKNYFINVEVQKKIIVTNLLYICLVMLLTMAAMNWQVVDKIGGMSNTEELRSTGSFVFHSLGLYFILAAAFVLAVINQLWITHRLCGALVNFVNTFQEISKGDLTQKIALRQDDFLKKEAIQFNDMVDELSELISKLKEDNRLLLSTLKGITGEAVDPGKVEEARKILKEQEPIFKENLSRLKLSEGGNF